jgi:hypothetical protein
MAKSIDEIKEEIKKIKAIVKHHNTNLRFLGQELELAEMRSELKEAQENAKGWAG